MCLHGSARVQVTSPSPLHPPRLICRHVSSARWCPLPAELSQRLPPRGLYAFGLVPERVPDCRSLGLCSLPLTDTSVSEWLLRFSSRRAFTLVDSLSVASVAMSSLLSLPLRPCCHFALSSQWILMASSRRVELFSSPLSGPRCLFLAKLRLPSLYLYPCVRLRILEKAMPVSQKKEQSSPYPVLPRVPVCLRDTQGNPLYVAEVCRMSYGHLSRRLEEAPKRFLRDCTESPSVRCRLVVCPLFPPRRL